jgi:hypothetical protein
VLIACAPFGGKLDANAMLATQRDLEARLQEIQERSQGRGDGEDEDGNEEAAAAADWGEQGAVANAIAEDAAAAAAQKEDGGEEVAAAMEVDDDEPVALGVGSEAAAAVVVVEESLMHPTQLQPTQPQSQNVAALGALAGDITTLRTLVATLKVRTRSPLSSHWG